jgi:eukaryotic translation initiation factor 2C
VRFSHSLLISVLPIVIFPGADTGHGGPGTNQPSVASIVWSYEPNAVKYKTLMRLQAPRTEIIKELYEMMEACNLLLISRLAHYSVSFIQYAIKDNARCQGGPPRRIIFFRDGVAETQFQAVMDEEVKAIQCMFIDLSYLTIL